MRRKRLIWPKIRYVKIMPYWNQAFLGAHVYGMFVHEKNVVYVASTYNWIIRYAALLHELIHWFVYRMNLPDPWNGTHTYPITHKLRNKTRVLTKSQCRDTL